jgi:beta-lactam-binding protein with PASTA domain
MKKIFHNIIKIIYPYRNLLKHLSLSFLTVFLLFFLWYKYLDYFTNKGDFVKVPTFENVYYKDLNSLVNDIDLQFEVTDTGYDRSKQRGIILSQYPLPNTDVKPGRTIKLKINSLHTRKVKFPNVIDLPYIQAINELTNKGFRIDTIIQKPNMAIDRVLAVVVKGTNNEISINQELYEGTSVNLIIGSEKEREPIGTPNLIGLIRQDAEMELKTKKLNIGTIQLYDGNQFIDINDTLMYVSDSIILFKQDPVPGQQIRTGDYVDLYFTFHTAFNDSIMSIIIDEND